MELDSATLIVIPQKEWVEMKSAQQEILLRLKELNVKGQAGIVVRHVTAKEFMDAVRIKRTKFDQLVQTNKIKIIKKNRKIYVPVSEIDRFFSDPNVI